MFGRLGTVELLIIAVFALLIFGPRRLPEFARSVGRSLTEFRQGLRTAFEEEAAIDIQQESITSSVSPAKMKCEPRG